MGSGRRIVSSGSPFEHRIGSSRCVRVGSILTLALLIDAPLMLMGGPMQMTLGQYVADIG